MRVNWVMALVMLAASTAFAGAGQETHSNSASGVIKPGQPVADASEQRDDIADADGGTYRSEPESPLVKELRTSRLRLQSSVALVVDQKEGRVLYEKNVDTRMPIASITKLMTAMVLLDARLPMNEKIKVTEADVDTLRHSSSRLTVGTTLTRRELLRLALMSSENRAAAALARTYPGGTQAFVAAMNRKAAALGMHDTSFIDPTGLHSENEATAEDLAKMVRASYQYPTIREFTTTASQEVDVRGRRIQEFKNTNLLVRNRNPHWDIGLSKTGFINEAGHCLVMQAKIAKKAVIIVLLDSWGKYSRIGDANRIRQWIESARAREAGHRLAANDA